MYVFSARTYPDVTVIVISFENWTNLDYTVVLALSSLTKGLNKDLVFTECGSNWMAAFQSMSSRSQPHCCRFSELSDYLERKYHQHQHVNSNSDEEVKCDEKKNTPGSSSNTTVLQMPKPTDQSGESLNPLLSSV